jgi:lincosamide nucleotidyltransferase A/C/D/E
VLAGAGVDVWIDGGWGVDALVGEQTREHDDLDLVVPIVQLGTARAPLEKLGFRLAVDWLPTRCKLEDGRGRGVDLHPVTFRADGSAWQHGLGGDAPYQYPREGFAARGRIGGREVRCLSADVQLRHHLGYEPGPKDRVDMELLRDRLGLALQPPY